MDLRRLRAGEWIAALGGAALLGSLFLPWYERAPVACIQLAGFDCPDPVRYTAWEALAANDVILAIVAASGVALLVVTATQQVPAVPIAMAAIVTLAGVVGTVLVLVRVGWTPDGAPDRAGGLWLGLAGALAIVVGGVIAMRDERISSPGRPTDSTGRPTPPPPEVEAIPAPRP
jgi:hypothetical protein